MNHCKNCHYDDKDGRYYQDKCICCSDNPDHQKSFFKPKAGSLHNLFKGAPVMWRDVSFGEDEDWTMSKVGQSVFTGDLDCLEFRLPSIEESPVNTWLAYSGDGSIPEGAEDLEIMTWLEGCTLPNLNVMSGRCKRWANVARFMIINTEEFTL